MKNSTKLLIQTVISWIIMFAFCFGLTYLACRWAVHTEIERFTDTVIEKYQEATIENNQDTIVVMYEPLQSIR